MKKYLLRISQILALLIVGSVVLLYLTRSHAVLLKIPPDDTIRPRYHSLLNPFRDKAPEQLAEQYLNRLREGDVEVILPYIDERKYILENEKKWPIQSWRVGSREDTADLSRIMYWVKRGNGYAEDDYEEEVHFIIARSGSSWVMKSYGAIY